MADTRFIGEYPLTQPFRPFPAYGDRARWQALPEEARAYYFSKAEALKNLNWPSLPATLYMDYKRNGNRSRYEAICFKRRSDLFTLTMAECMQGEGAYLDDIINGLWLICEESTWVIPAHNNHAAWYEAPNELPDIEKPCYIDLFAAETGSLLSWVHYFLGEALMAAAPLVKRRIEWEIERRILNPYLTYDFTWMGLSHDEPVNNWNPWINSNVLIAFLIIGKGDQQAAGVHKAIRSTNRFLSFYEPDGGCDEGPGYFNVAGASLLDFLEELAHAAPEAQALYDEPMIQNMARYIYKVYIGNQYYVNFADAPPRVKAAATLLARTGEKIHDDNLIGFSAYLLDNGLADPPYASRTWTVYRSIANIFGKQPSGNFKAPAFSWFEGIQVACARDAEGSLNGFFMAAKGGHNAESHNHNDIGNFILYYNGEPVLIDAGVETYTKKTFSETRYDIWTMQSCYHNTPDINGCTQAPGGDFRAAEVVFAHENQTTRLGMELKNAYPPEAGIQTYRREFVFSHGKGLAVTDTYRLVVCKKPLAVNFMSYAKPVLGEGVIGLNKGVSMVYDAGVFTASAEEIILTDAKIRADWQQDYLYRIVLTAKDMNQEDSFTLRLVK